MIEKFITSLQNADTSEYRSIPFWSWNDELETEELCRQILWMKENGIGGFFMHARSGLKTEYLSEKWFECIKLCAEEAEKNGMDAWAYDENGWPSGFVGGKLLEKEENRDCYISYTLGEFDINSTVSYLLDGDRLIRTSKAQSGKYLNLYIETAVSTTDILNPDLVKSFLKLTHNEYKKSFGDDFSKKIKGFFTDEPQYQRWKTPYSRMLPEYFKEHYGIDILDQLGLLILKKQGYRKFRYLYWKAMQELMLNNFAKQIYTWCDKNGIELTGHYAQEDTLGLQMTSNAGVMPFYQYEHIPGIDWLGRATDSEITAKQVSSAAAQLGKKRVLTETFGCCGWDISPAELGRILGYQFVHGVNMFCQHLVPYAEHGNRKRDFPAHFSPMNPWIKEGFKDFNTIFTRLGYLLGESEVYVNVAVIHPIRSVYFDYSRELEDEQFGVGEIENSFKETCNKLLSLNIAHHFLDETLLSQYGFVEGNRIGCGSMQYNYLIIPSIITMDVKTEQLLKEYAKNGGKIILMGKKPCFLEYKEFNYDYLETNCDFDEIIMSQPYSVKNADTRVVSVMAEYKGMPFIFAQNSSSEKEYKQTFLLDGKYKSFEKVDLLTYKTETVPFEVEFEKNEFALLIPSDKEITEKTCKSVYNLRFDNAEASFDKNTFTLDLVSFSDDGISYSKPYYTVALYEKLIKNKYDGKLYLKYEFDVKDLPKNISIRAEEFSISNASLNGHKLAFSEEKDWNRHYYTADVSKHIKQGKNEYVIMLDWRYDENVYMALYGENVTESLKNHLLNQNEIEAVYLEGRFGVYSSDGFVPSEHKDFICANKFYIGKVPKKISEPVTDGLPFFSGCLKLSQTINFYKKDIVLFLDGNYQMADIKINGKDVKTVIFERKVDVSDFITVGDNLIEADIVIGLRNTLGPHHYCGEKYEDLSPFKFELTDTWEDDKSPLYHSHYDFLKLYQ